MICCVCHDVVCVLARQVTRPQRLPPIIRNLPPLRLLNNRRITPITYRTNRISRNLRPRVPNNLIRPQLKLITRSPPPPTHSPNPTRQRSQRNRRICPRALAAAGVCCIADLADHAAFEHGEELFQAGEGGGHDCDVGCDCCDDCDADAGVD